MPVRLRRAAPPTSGRAFDVVGPELRFLGLTATDGSATPLRDELHVVLNWIEELKGKVK